MALTVGLTRTSTWSASVQGCEYSVLSLLACQDTRLYIVLYHWNCVHASEIHIKKLQFASCFEHGSNVARLHVTTFVFLKLLKAIGDTRSAFVLSCNM